MRGWVGHVLVVAGTALLMLTAMYATAALLT